MLRMNQWRVALGTAPPKRWPTSGRMSLSSSWRDLADQLCRLAAGSIAPNQIRTWVGTIEKQSRWVPAEMTLNAILLGTVAIAEGQLPRPRSGCGVTNTS